MRPRSGCGHPHHGVARTRAQRLKATPDRIEASGDDFHQRVDHGFRELAAADPHRWVVIDGDGTVDSVADAIWSAITTRGQWGQSDVPSWGRINPT